MENHLFLVQLLQGVAVEVAQIIMVPLQAALAVAEHMVPDLVLQEKQPYLKDTVEETQLQLTTVQMEMAVAVEAVLGQLAHHAQMEQTLIMVQPVEQEFRTL
jgi:hypothetical protein